MRDKGGIIDKDMTTELQKKVDRAIKLIQSASQMVISKNSELEVAVSGGKDSDVILELTKMAGVPYRAIHRCTTIDPPGTIKHVKELGCEVIRPEKTFFQMMATKGWPSRKVRWCCSELKEKKVLDYAILGIRAEESAKRKARYKEPEMCRVYNKTDKTRQYFPILNWTKKDVADFIAERGIKCHPSYYDADGHFHAERRLGCLCCPMQSKRQRIADFKQYPRFVYIYIYKGLVFRNLHKMEKNKTMFMDVYEWFVCYLFCDSIAEFRERFGPNLFDKGIDCKKFLEDYFKIKFDDDKMMIK